MFKLAKVNMDIKFIVKCKELDLIPKFCRIKLTYLGVIKFIHSSLLAYGKTVNIRHAAKFNWLDRQSQTNVTFLDNDKIVVNLSSYILSDTEVQLLSKGLQFSIPPLHLDQTDTMTTFELLYNQAAPGIKGNLNRLKHRLKTLCYQYIFLAYLWCAYAMALCLSWIVHREVGCVCVQHNYPKMWMD